MKRIVSAVILICVMFAGAANTALAAEGMLLRQSNYSAAETADRLEAQLKANGMTLFPRLDHASAAAAAGLALRPMMVVVFGNPRVGTPLFIQSPTFAIDLPLKALVWEDEDEKVWIGYNSAEYVNSVIRSRHGLQGDDTQMQAQSQLLDRIVSAAVK